VVRYAITRKDMQVVGIRRSLTGLEESPPDAFDLTLADVDGIMGLGGTILETSNSGSPFRDKKQAEATAKQIQANWDALGLDALIVIGGDGTQLMARNLVERGFPVVGIPKTIDNDLPITARTIGFSTACEVATEAGIRLKSSAQAHGRTMIMEVMGRDAGHIAIGSAISAGADAVLIPEIPYEFKILKKFLGRMITDGRKNHLVVIAEGALPKGGERLYKNVETTNTVLGGIGEKVAEDLRQALAIEVRVTTLGHLQRGGPPNTEDRILATLFAKHAVDLVHSGRFGRVVSIEKGMVSDFDYQEINDTRRTLDPAGEWVLAAEATGICLGRTPI
jgi:6-phosphofructokinase 1